MKLLILGFLITPFLASSNVLFDSSYGTKNNPSELNTLSRNNEKSALKVQELLQDDSPFLGLYLRVEGRESLDSDYYDRRVGIDFELFENGYYQSLREMQNKRQESRLETLQQRNNIQLKQVDANLHQITLNKNFVKRRLQRRQTALLYALKETQQRQLENALITKAQFAEIDLALKQSLLLEEYTSNAKTSAIQENWINWLNNLENLKLKSVEKMLPNALARSTQLKIQDLMIERTENHPGYLDNLKLKVFYEQRDDSRLNVDKESVIGLQARIPIDFNFSRSQLVNERKESYKMQKHAVAVRLQQKLESLSSQFYFKQSSLKHLINKYALLEEERQQAIQQLQLDLTGLTYTPEDRLNRLALERVKLQQELLILRLDTFAILLHLMHTSHHDEVDSLIG